MRDVVGTCVNESVGTGESQAVAESESVSLSMAPLQRVPLAHK